MPTGGRGAIRRARQDRDREYHTIMRMMARQRIESQVADAMGPEHPHLGGKGNRYVGHGSRASTAEWAARDAYLEDPEALADDGTLICEACGDHVPLLEFRETRRAIHIRCITARKTVPRQRQIWALRQSTLPDRPSAPLPEALPLHVDGQTNTWYARVGTRSILLHTEDGGTIPALRPDQPDIDTARVAEAAAERLRQKLLPRRPTDARAARPKIPRDST